MVNSAQPGRPAGMADFQTDFISATAAIGTESDERPV